MAEDVTIVGIDGLPEWATEKTQQAILKELQNNFKMTSAQSKQVQQSMGAMGKGGKLSGTDVAKVGKALTSGLKDAADSAMYAAAGFDKLPGPMKKFGAELKKTSGMFKTALIGVGLLGNAIGTVLKTVQTSVQTLRGLTDTGVIFNESVLSMHSTLADTGLTLEKFGEIAGKYARVMGTNGLQSLTQFVTRTRDLTGGFERFGLTTGEATEYAAEFLDQQRLAGVFAQATNRRQSQALQENIERLTAYSKILNVSRQQMQESTRQMLDRDDLQAMFFTMAPEENAKAQQAFATISQGLASMGAPGAKLLEMFTDMAASPIEESSEAFRQLASASPEFAQELLQMSRNMKQGVAVSQEDLFAMAERASANKELINALRLGGGDIKTTAELIAGLGMASKEARVSQAQLAEKAAAAGLSLDAYLKTVDPNTAAATNLEDSMQRLQATMEYTMIKGFATLVGGELRDAVNGMAEGINWLTGKLREFADGTLEDIMLYIRKFFTDPGEAFSTLFDDVTTLLWDGLKYIADQISSAVAIGLDLIATKVAELNPFSTEASQARSADRVTDIDSQLARLNETLASGQYAPGQTEQSTRRRIAGLNARRADQMAALPSTPPSATVTTPTPVAASSGEAVSAGGQVAPNATDLSPVVQSLGVTNDLLKRIYRAQDKTDAMQ